MELMSLTTVCPAVLQTGMGIYVVLVVGALSSTRETDGECNFKGDGAKPNPQLPELPPSAESSRLV